MLVGIVFSNDFRCRCFDFLHLFGQSANLCHPSEVGLNFEGLFLRFNLSRCPSTNSHTFQMPRSPWPSPRWNTGIRQCQQTFRFLIAVAHGRKLTATQLHEIIIHDYRRHDQYKRTVQHAVSRSYRIKKYTKYTHNVIYCMNSTHVGHATTGLL